MYAHHFTCTMKSVCAKGTYTASSILVHYCSFSCNVLKKQKEDPFLQLGLSKEQQHPRRLRYWCVYPLMWVSHFWMRLLHRPIVYLSVTFVVFTHFPLRNQGKTCSPRLKLSGHRWRVLVFSVTHNASVTAPLRTATYIYFAHFLVLTETLQT